MVTKLGIAKQHEIGIYYVLLYQIISICRFNQLKELYKTKVHSKDEEIERLKVR